MSKLRKALKITAPEFGRSARARCRTQGPTLTTSHPQCLSCGQQFPDCFNCEVYQFMSKTLIHEVYLFVLRGRTPARAWTS